MELYLHTGFILWKMTVHVCREFNIFIKCYHMYPIYLYTLILNCCTV